MKIEKRITEAEFKKVLNESKSMDEITKMCDDYMIQELKDMMTKDAEFEVVEPKRIELQSQPQNQR